MAPIDPKIKTGDSNFQANGRTSEVHTFKNLQEEYHATHPPLTDDEVKKQNLKLWHQLPGTRVLPQLDNYRKKALKDIKLKILFKFWVVLMLPVSVVFHVF